MCLPRRKTPHSESHCCPPVTPDLRRGRVSPQIGVTRCQIPDASDFLVFFCFTVFSSFFGHVCTDLSPLSCFFKACGCAHSTPGNTRLALLSLSAILRLIAFFWSTLFIVAWASNLFVEWNVLKWVNMEFLLLFSFCVCVCVRPGFAPALRSFANSPQTSLSGSLRLSLFTYGDKKVVTVKLRFIPAATPKRCFCVYPGFFRVPEFCYMSQHRSVV